METEKHEMGIGDCSEDTPLPITAPSVAKRGHVATIVVLAILLVLVLVVLAMCFCGYRHTLHQAVACCPCGCAHRRFDSLTNEVRIQSNPVYDQRNAAAGQQDQHAVALGGVQQGVGGLSLGHSASGIHI